MASSEKTGEGDAVNRTCADGFMLECTRVAGLDSVEWGEWIQCCVIVVPMSQMTGVFGKQKTGMDPRLLSVKNNPHANHKQQRLDEATLPSVPIRKARFLRICTDQPK